MEAAEHPLTGWIEWQICQDHHPPGCNCTPMPSGVPPTGATVPPPPPPPPPTSTPGEFVSRFTGLPFYLSPDDSAVQIAADLTASGLRPDLAASMAAAIFGTGVGWWITSALRSVGEQDALIASGDTRTPPRQSNHVPCPGEVYGTAVDLDPAVDEAREDEYLALLARRLQTTRVGWRWGGTFRRPSKHHYDVPKECR